MFDIAIIGAGVIGTGIARELMKYDVNVVVLEKDSDVSCGASKANSAIVHAGYDASVDSLKGKFNKLGSDMFEEICKELDVEYERVGSYVVAFDDKDIKTLNALKQNGESLGIEGLQIISGDEMLKREANLSEDIVAALYAPTAAITNPFGLTIAYMENAMDNGAKLLLNFEVSDIANSKSGFIIKSKDDEIKSKCVINASGISASDIYSMVANDVPFYIRPRRGEYYLLDRSEQDLVNSVVFQCPTEMGKGVIIIPTVHGNTMIGPSSEDLSADQKFDSSTTQDGLEFVKNHAKKIIEDISFEKNITNFTGIRAEPSTKDFIIEESSVDNFFNVAGIKSPGLSSAPAIAKYVAELINMKFKLDVNYNYNPIRKGYINLFEKNDDEINELIKRDSKFGNIICRCESVTEGEIIDSIHRNCGGTSLNGIKRRVRPGSGRCQGSFCGPRVLEILARERKISRLEINQENINSKVLTDKTKDK